MEYIVAHHDFMNESTDASQKWPHWQEKHAMHNYYEMSDDCRVPDSDHQVISTEVEIVRC